MGATDNVKVFEAGMRRAEAAIQKEFVRQGENIARTLIQIAVSSYQVAKANLTGNLLNSICGGVYYNKNLQRIVKPRVKEATHTYAHVGDKGFLEFDSMKPIEYVRQYQKRREGLVSFKFQDVPNGSGSDDAIDFLMGYKPPKGSLGIIICAAAPYAEYLQNVRGLDVLTTSFNNADGVFNEYIELTDIKL